MVLHLTAANSGPEKSLCCGRGWERLVHTQVIPERTACPCPNHDPFLFSSGPQHMRASGWKRSRTRNKAEKWQQQGWGWAWGRTRVGGTIKSTQHGAWLPGPDPCGIWQSVGVASDMLRGRRSKGLPARSCGAQAKRRLMGGQGQRGWPMPSKVGPTGHRGDQRHSRKRDS